jgi:endonuclease/exonuclease/phosphatase family metal-dependent hydrolase
MKITVGTFNVNNLFSRFNFELKVDVPDLPAGNVSLEKVRTITAALGTKNVEYKSVALHRKDPAARQAVAKRIESMNIDVLVVQEVEDIDTLRYFVTHELSNPVMYPYLILVEGNDPRLIDIAVMSKYPIGEVATWQHAVHPDKPDERVFSRDLLQVQILSQNRSHHLFTLFCNHLKSHYVPWNEDQKAGETEANARRQRQAETAAKIIGAQLRPDSAFIVLGDMNDDVGSPYLKALTTNPTLGLVNGLLQADETQPAPHDTPPAPNRPWTDRFKPAHKPAEYMLFDQIWLSPHLSGKQTGAFINRRTRLGGDGSDHDPAWVELDI